MALSDVCFDFVQQTARCRSDKGRRKAVMELRQDALSYRGSPLGYSASEIDGLVSACDSYLDGASTSVRAAELERLCFLAETVRGAPRGRKTQDS